MVDHGLKKPYNQFIETGNTRNKQFDKQKFIDNKIYTTYINMYKVIRKVTEFQYGQ